MASNDTQHYVQNVRVELLEPLMASLAARLAELRANTTEQCATFRGSYFALQQTLARVAALSEELTNAPTYEAAVEVAQRLQSQAQHVGDGNGECNVAEGGVYRGALVDGVPHGHGSLTYHDGRVHTGNFVQGLPQGAGTVAFPDGDEMEGHWAEGKLHGVVTFRPKGGEWVAESTFECNVPAGCGKVMYRDGTIYQGELQGWQPCAGALVAAA